jgi:ribosomal protein S18 acetylase RimI-like enzyme
MTVRQLTVAEDRAAGELFARAFINDPFAVRVGPRHPGLRRRLRAREYLLEITALRRTGALLCCAGSGDGASLVGVLTADRETPELRRRPSRGDLTMAGGGPAVMRRAMTGEQTLAAARPTSAHLYIVKVAVADGHRGSGIGRALIEHAVSEADAQGIPTLLDTMLPETAAYYERFGFHTTRRLPLFPDLDAWLMARPAGAGSP